MLDFQFWSDRSWQSFNQSEQHALNTNFSQTPRPDSVNLGLREVKNFSQVHQGHAEQKNKSTGKLRWVRIKPPYQIDGGVQPHLPPLFHFCYEENGTWFPFNQEHQAELVSYAKSAPPPGQVVFYIRGQEYVLLGMDALVKDANAACMQVNVFTNRTRIVRIQSGPAPVVPAPAFSMGPARHSVRSVSGALGGGSHSSSGYGYNPRSSASASAPSSFSLSSAVFLVETANGRKHLSSHWADEIRRHWRMSPRPDQVPLSDGSLVENFQALECGSAVLRSRDGAQKLEVRLESQIGPGSLNLPNDLESEDQKVDLSSVGKYLSAQEQRRLPDSDKECSICSEDLVAAEKAPVPSWAAARFPSRAQAASVDDDGDVVMEEVHSTSAGSTSVASGPVYQLRCGHVYHTECLKKWFEQRASCPLCLKEFGKVVGTQPWTGSFQWHVDRTVQLPGHMGARGAIMILFEFPPGTDDAGRPYPGRREKGFLPNNCQGIIQLELFKVAFRRRVMFALSTSLTTGRFKPTFNIHIKTKPRGGAAQHGYPDNDYFQRSLDELKNVGISVADLPAGMDCST